MCGPTKVEWSRRAMENGHNWNCLRLLTGNNRAIQGHKLTEVKFIMKEETVLLLLKKDSPKGPMVAFMETKDLDAALSVLGAAIRGQTVPWKPDKFRSMRIDKE